MSITVTDITKTYGVQKALDNISFSIEKGEIVGFLGPNGAGKSTMMKILTTYLSPTIGEATVNHFDTAKETKSVQTSVGYLPEHNPLYTDMYVREYLQFNASVYNVPKDRITEVIDLTGLTPEAHKKISQLSKGYRQRVGLANALLHNPEVLILDEPTTGLDPNQLLEIRKLIKDIGSKKTILMSTHIMQVVEFDYRIEDVALNKLDKVISVKNTHDFIYEITFDTAEDMRSKVFDFAHDNGLKILQLNQKNASLESLFTELTS